MLLSSIFLLLLMLLSKLLISKAAAAETTEDYFAVDKSTGSDYEAAGGDKANGDHRSPFERDLKVVFSP